MWIIIWIVSAIISIAITRYQTGKILLSQFIFCIFLGPLLFLMELIIIIKNKWNEKIF